MPKGGVLAAEILAAGFLAIQLVPVERTNPPVETEVPASAEAREVLRRACYDCHSNEVVWPWYAQIAPASWLIARDVREGREEVNYSTWNRLDEDERREALEESWEEIADGEMPPWSYLPLHPAAKLSDADRRILDHWSRLPPHRAPDAAAERAARARALDPFAQ
ncbi:MAG: heme-binding domain-containing protein [Myxococcota bacterium]